MVDQTELQKLKEDYPDFFKKTAPEIIEFALSDETSEKIADIAERNGVLDEQIIEGVAQRVTWVLLDRLPSGNLALTLELGLGLTPETAQKIASEANQFISSALSQPKSLKTTPSKMEAPEEKPEGIKKQDVYREPTE